MPATWHGKRMIAVISACMTANGTPTFVANEVEVTHDEYENGVHYLLVEDRLNDAGYEEPWVHFDEMESPPWLHQAVREQADNPIYFVRNPADATLH